jgi:hypothetical protein
LALPSIDILAGPEVPEEDRSLRNEAIEQNIQLRQTLREIAVPRPGDLRTVLPQHPLAEPVVLAMAHGLLDVSGSMTNEHGLVVHQATYMPAAPGVIVASRFSDFLPAQQNLVAGQLQTYTDDLQKVGDAEGMEPIAAAPTPDGNLVLLDGHHRLAAALQTGVSIPVEIHTTVEAGAAVARDWSSVRIIDQ